MLLPTSEVEACPRVYRPRRPKGSALFHLVEECYEDVKGVWEERYEAKYGRWRGFVDETIYAFSDCGDLSRGFARVLCDACRSEYLLAPLRAGWNTLAARPVQTAAFEIEGGLIRALYVVRNPDKLRHLARA